MDDLSSYGFRTSSVDYSARAIERVGQLRQGNYKNQQDWSCVYDSTPQILAVIREVAVQIMTLVAECVMIKNKFGASVTGLCFALFVTVNYAYGAFSPTHFQLTT